MYKLNSFILHLNGSNILGYVREILGNHMASKMYLSDGRTGRKTALLPPSLGACTLWHGTRCGRLLWARGHRGREERVGYEVLEADPVLGVPLEKVVQEVGKLWAGATWDPRGQPGVPLVELLQSLRGLGLEGGLASEALEDDGAQGPQVRAGVILQGHDHLGGL